MCKPAAAMPSPSLVPSAPLAPAAGGRGLCSNYGCGGFNRQQSCQCNDNCKDYANCCSDYTDTCLESDNPPPPGAPSATAAASGAAWAGGALGRPDGGAKKGGKKGGGKKGGKDAGAEGAAGGGSLGCADYGCGDYNEDQGCQCNMDCVTFDSCCSDYQ